MRRGSFRKVAAVSDVSPSAVKRILYGNSKHPGVVTIKKLWGGLDMSLTEVFSGEEFAGLEPEIQ